MPFRAIFLLLFATQTAGAAQLTRSNLSVRGANTAATRIFKAEERSAVQEKAAPKQPREPRKRAKREALVQTFVGTVEWEYKPLSWDCDVPNCDHFALYDDATGLNYELDNARAALPFEGIRAKVMGVVDTKNGIIHLISIKAAK
jgi:hypothetical protein